MVRYPQDIETWLASITAEPMYLKIAYASGIEAATVKVGTMAGPIAYAPDPGVMGVGGIDANRLLADRDLRNADAITRAFDTNENVDMSNGPESAMTQPHGSRYAAWRRDLQKLAVGPSLGLGGGVGGGGMGGLRSAGLGGAKSMMGGGMGAPKPPQAPAMPKPMQARDPRADKPPGMNLQHAVQTTSGISDMGTSIGSRFRRLDGSPM